MATEARPSITDLLLDDALIDGALRQGIREAIELHKRAGLPMVISRGGRIEWLSAEEMERFLNEEEERMARRR